MRAAVYARVSTQDQQTLGLQVGAMAADIKDRGWGLARQVEDVGSGAKDRPGRDSLLKAAGQAHAALNLLSSATRFRTCRLSTGGSEPGGDGPRE